MSDVVQFKVKRKDRYEREFSSWSSSSFDLTSVPDVVLDTLGRAMLQNHGYCHLTIINELAHRSDHHQAQADAIREEIKVRNVSKFLREHLEEVMIDPAHAMRIITNAIELQDVTEGRIWFTDEEYKVDTINDAYRGTMLLSAVYASDIKLEADAKAHEQKASKLSNIADNFTKGHLVFLTANGPQVLHCSQRGD